MALKEGYVDQSTALFEEIHAQLRDFQPNRFREFYSDFIGKKLDSRQVAEALGVDFATASYFYTVPACDLDTGLFGIPNDQLLTQADQFTESALEALGLVRNFVDRMAKCRHTSQIPYLNPGHSIEHIKITLFIGRRSLGATRYEKFKVRAVSFMGSSSHDAANLRLEVRSFDTIVDYAMTFALKPFPFPNQELLKTILDTGGEAVRQEALKRLDRTQENAPIFERYLTLEGPVQSAAAGARDIQKLKAVLAKAGDNEWLSVFLRTRISILQGDWEAIEAVATSPTYFGSVFMALEAIHDERALERIRSRIKGETPRDVCSRLIIAAKLASRMGDAAKIDEAIQQAAQMNSEDAEQALIRIKLQFEAEQKTAPEVFISYRHESEEHREWVRKLAEDLRQNGINALLDQWELHLGDSIGDFGSSAIFRAKAMLFVITPASVTAVEADERTRSVVKFEFQLANARRYRDGNFRIIGILRSGERPPNHLADTLYLDFRQKDDYAVQVLRLIKDLLGESDRPLLARAIS